MKEVLDFLKEYWVLITFFVGEIAVVYAFISHIKKALKCTLRKDILDIYDACKEKKEITMYQLQCVSYSYDVYKKFKGNSFFETIMEKEIPNFKVVE